MKHSSEIRTTLYVALFSIILLSCAPRYGAHFQKSSRSEYDTKVTANHQVQPLTTPENENIDWSNVTASIDDKVLESPIMQVVKKHAEKVKTLENSTAPVKEVKKEMKVSKRDFRKEIKAEFKREIKRAKAAGDGDYTLMMILGILIAPLGVGLTYGIGTEFWISLLLFLLFWLPGAIYGGIKVHQFYKG